jgi:hypothetical protein
MSTTFLSRCLSVGVMALAFAPPALAQERHVVELSGAYQFLLKLPEDESLYPNSSNYPVGFAASAAWNATRRLALLGEFSQSATTVPKEDVVGHFSAIDRTAYSTTGGARWRFGSLFVQALFGQAAVAEQREELLGSVDEVKTGVLLQPGFGFDIAVTSRVSTLIQVDYRHVTSDEGPYKRQIRIAAGVAVGVGPRR